MAWGSGKDQGDRYLGALAVACGGKAEGLQLLNDALLKGLFRGLPLESTSGEDYALQRDEPRVFHNPEEILNDLTDDGLTKTRWFSMQRVIGNTQIKGDTAFVEVSFIDKARSKQYYNKFGLHKKDNSWKIYSFRTISR